MSWKSSFNFSNSTQIVKPVYEVNSMHTDWSSLSLCFFLIVMILAHFYKKPPIHYLNKLEYFLRPIKNSLVNCWPFWKVCSLLYKCTQWSVCGTAEVVWKPRFLWQWPSAHLHFLVSCFSFSSDNTPLFIYGVQGLVSLLASQAHQAHQCIIVHN